MSTGTVQMIKDNASWHANLYTALVETADASEKMQQQSRFITETEKHLASANSRLADREKKRQKEFREHEDYRDSHFKKFAYKVGGKSDKFEARQSKEEEEYHESLRMVKEAEGEVSNLEGVLSDAREHRGRIEQEISRNRQAQHDLDQLYGNIFGESQCGYPMVDEAHQRSSESRRDHDNASEAVQKETHVVNCLTDARKTLERARRSMDDALKWSTRDLMGGGTIADMKEREALHMADREIGAAVNVHKAAQQTRPGLSNLPNVHVPVGNVMSDVFFDNVFTDMNFHQKIKQAGMELQKVIRVLETQLDQARHRQVDLRGTWSSKVQSMKAAQGELQNMRKAVFDSVAQAGPTGGTEPAAGTETRQRTGAVGSGNELSSNNPFLSAPPPDEPPPYQG